MTKVHALIQLLRLGPLTLRELREITGWDPKQLKGLLQYLINNGDIFRINDGRTRLYTVPASLLLS